MTAKVREQLWQPKHQHLLDYVQGTLEADVARRKASASWHTVVQPADIERLFASIELLIDRYEQPWSPFVASWTAGLESFAPDAGLRINSLSGELRQFESAFNNSARGGMGAGRAISRALEAVVKRAIEGARPGDVGRALSELRDAMIGSLDAVLRPSAGVDYLNPLIDLAADQGGLTAASLNYDNCVELACAERRVPCDTAIETWLRDPTLWPETGVRLLKLHGSIDWILQNARQPLSETLVRQAGEDERVREPAIVFGEGGKLRAQGPFLELLLQWARDLSYADRLLIIGYSFRDDHINEGIARWFNRDERRRIVLLSPTALYSSTGLGRRVENPVLSQLVGLGGHPRDQDPPAPRFLQVRGRARDVLPEAVARAQEDDDWPAQNYDDEGE